MDLHDYKDVAENYDRYLEVMFETNNAHEGFQEFYLELAKRHGQNGVVDIACGTGAVDIYGDYKWTKADENLAGNLIWVMRKKYTASKRI